jgi:hypothetical protein
MSAVAGALAVLAGGAVATAGPDAPPVVPQITDPTGDSTGGAAFDIVSGGWSTSGTTTYTTVTTYTIKIVKSKVVKVVNGKKTKVTVSRKVRVPHTRQVPHYKPDTVVGKLTVAAPPSSTAGAYYELDFTAAGCGQVIVTYAPGSVATDPSQTGFVDFHGCKPGALPGDTGTFLAFTPKVAGTTIELDIPLSQLPSKLGPGAQLTALAASTGLAEPVFGAGVVANLYDDATSSTPYTVG